MYNFGCLFTVPVLGGRHRVLDIHFFTELWLVNIQFNLKIVLARQGEEQLGMLPAKHGEEVLRNFFIKYAFCQYL